MDLTIADQHIALELPGDGMAERLHGRYGAFLGAAPGSTPAFTLSFSVDPLRRPPNYHPEHVDNPETEAEGDLDRAVLRGDVFEAEFDWTRGTGSAVIPDSLAHLDLCVRVALGVALLREGGTLLHASAVVRDHFGIAFSGPSGAGKSTVARLCAADGLDVLADEMIAFRRTGVGARFYGSPFWRGAAASAPCGAILFLEQAAGHDVEHLTPAAALPRLMAAGGAPLALPAIEAAFFAACGEVLRRVPAYRLRFTPDTGFWPVLDRRPEFAFFRPAAAAPRTGTPPAPLSGLRRPAGAADDGIPR